jgi:hypothetical protein
MYDVAKGNYYSSNEVNHPSKHGRGLVIPHMPNKSFHAKSKVDAP